LSRCTVDRICSLSDIYTIDMKLWRARTLHFNWEDIMPTVNFVPLLLFFKIYFRLHYFFLSSLCSVIQNISPTFVLKIYFLMYTCLFATKAHYYYCIIVSLLIYISIFSFHDFLEAHAFSDDLLHIMQSFIKHSRFMELLTDLFQCSRSGPRRYSV